MHPLCRFRLCESPVLYGPKSPERDTFANAMRQNWLVLISPFGNLHFLIPPSSVQYKNEALSHLMKNAHWQILFAASRGPAIISHRRPVDGNKYQFFFLLSVSEPVLLLSPRVTRGAPAPHRQLVVPTTHPGAYRKDVLIWEQKENFNDWNIVTNGEEEK